VIILSNFVFLKGHLNFDKSSIGNIFNAKTLF